MVMTPAMRHKQRKLAQAAGAAAAKSGEMIGATAYELQLAQLAAHKRQLKELQSIERKVALKRELLPAYLPYIEGILDADGGAQDDVLMTMMVWSVDVGDLPLALRIGAYALTHGLTTPDQYARDTATLLAELHADEALREGGEVDVGTLQAVNSLTSDHDMPDEVRAKLHRAIGLSLEKAGELEPALDNLKRAVQLNERVGAKKDIERIERAIKNAAPDQNDPNRNGQADGQPPAGEPAAPEQPASGDGETNTTASEEQAASDQEEKTAGAGAPVAAGNAASPAAKAPAGNKSGGTKK